MLTHNLYGSLTCLAVWTNPWTRSMWGGFEAHDGTYVNLPLSEVEIVA